MEGGNIKLSWASSKDNYDLPVTYHLYGSNVYPVDTNNAENLLQTYIQDNETSVKNEEGKRYFAITATDRYGNESEALALNKPSDKDIPILNQGNKLFFPQSGNAQEILICNVIGETISRMKYHLEISLELLPKGFYLVYALDKEGEKTLIGTILK